MTAKNLHRRHLTETAERSRLTEDQAEKLRLLTVDAEKMRSLQPCPLAGGSQTVYGSAAGVSAIRSLEGSVTTLQRSLEAHTNQERASAVQVQSLMELLHDIAGAFQARRSLEKPNLTEPLRKSMTEKAWSDEQIEDRALKLWEQIATQLAQAKKG